VMRVRVLGGRERREVGSGMRMGMGKVKALN
jgi:hypothetical protein